MFFDYRVDYVYDPLLWQFFELHGVWQMKMNFLGAYHMRQNRINVQTLVLWNLQVLDFASFNYYKTNFQLNKMACLLTLLLSTHQIFKEIDGDSIVRWQICLAIDSKKVKYFSLAFVFTSKGHSCYLLFSMQILINLRTHVFICHILDMRNFYFNDRLNFTLYLLILNRFRN